MSYLYRLALIPFIFSAAISTEVHSSSNSENRPGITGELQEDPPLEGIILDADSDEPLPGATIFLSEVETGSTAGRDGKFRIEALPPGSYMAEVRFIGYRSRIIEIDHPVDDELVIRLEADLIRSLDVVVTSSPLGRDLQYQPARALNVRELQARTAPSVGEILDGSPGVTMRSFGSAPARPVIRGMDGERILILQNGERLGDLSATAHDHAVHIDPLLIDRVEVVRGPASLLYGSSALGGVVNLFSFGLPREWDEGRGGELRLQGASVNRLGAGTIRGRIGEEQWALTGFANYRHGGNIRTPDGHLPGSWLDSYSFGSGFGYRNGRIESGTVISTMGFDYGLPEGLDDPAESVEIRSDRWSAQSITTIGMSGSFFEKLELRMNADWFDQKEIEVERVGDGTVEEDLDLRFEQLASSGTVLMHHRPLAGFEGVWGLHLNYRNIEVSGDEALTPDARSAHAGLFIYEEVDIGQITSFQLGSRLEYQRMGLHENEMFYDVSEYGVRRNLIFSGSVGFNVRPTERLELGMQLARAYRTPTLEELYADAPHPGAGVYEIGDSDLSNEVSIGSDLFIRYLDDSVHIEVTGFLNLVNHYIMFSPTGETDNPSGLPVYYYHAHDATLKGFEADLQMQLSQRFRTGFTLDAVYGSRRDADSTPLPYMPPPRLRWNMEFESGSWSAGMRLRGVSSQNRVAPLEEPTGRYLLAGLDAGYRFDTGVRVHARLDNLFNVRYRDHLSRVEDRQNPMPGRNLVLSIHHEF